MRCSDAELQSMKGSHSDFTGERGIGYSLTKLLHLENICANLMLMK
jgi:hypothetical protein